MTATTPEHEALAAAMCAALSPYLWRRLTPELLARMALAARDRHLLAEVLASVRGADPGRWEALEPVGRDDARVAHVVESVRSHRWTELSLHRLCEHLAGVLRPEAC